MASIPDLPVATAAVACAEPGGGTTLRVYSSNGYAVTERMTTGSGWVDGPFQASGAAVSATTWTDANGVYVRVYCTGEDATTEWCLDPGGTDYYQGQYTLS